MADNLKSFRDMVAASQPMRDRWLAASERAIDLAARVANVSLDREEAAELLAVRVAVLSAQPLDEFELTEQLGELGKVKQAKRKAEVAKKLADGDEKTVAEFQALPRAARITKAREMGQTYKKEVKPAISVADEATLLRRLLTLSPQQRINEARKKGLIR